MEHRTPILFAVLLAVATGAEAQTAKKRGPEEQEVVPAFYNLPSSAENSWLTMSCKPAPSLQTLECHFAQLSIRRKSEDDIKKAVAEALDELRAAPEELSGKKLAKICLEGMKRAEKQPPPESAARKAGLEAEMAPWRALCACTDMACRAATFARAVEQQERVCKLDVYEFDLTLERAGKNKWISNPGPTGLCDVVNVVIIERNEDLLWTYTQTRLSVGDPEGCEYLKAGVNVPLRYSWNAQNTLAMDCDLIKAGL